MKWKMDNDGNFYREVKRKEMKRKINKWYWILWGFIVGILLAWIVFILTGELCGK